ncbi:MAG: bifunctional oligoribonuclease/PAP phosphatase NrnA [Planctomycetota bacterium]
MTAVEWSSTVSAGDIAAWLDGSDDVQVLTHARPDGDAIGSCFALARAINRRTRKRTARVIFTGTMPRWFDTFADDTPWSSFERADPAPGMPDRLVVVDTGSWSQLDALAEHVREVGPERTAVIDHHLRGDPDISPRRLLTTSAAAACEPVAEFCVRLLGLPGPTELPEDIARCLYLGIATDTGWFRHSNVTPATLRLAADLIAAGVDHAALYSMIEQSEKPARLKIIAASLNSLELLDRDRIAIMRLRLSDIAEAHAGPEDTGGLADFPLRIQSVRVAASITEVETADGGPRAKISLRSKPGPGMIDVNAVAGRLGGGGHANASGARIDGTVDEARDRLVAVLTR